MRANFDKNFPATFLTHEFCFDFRTQSLWNGNSAMERIYWIIWNLSFSHAMVVMNFKWNLTKFTRGKQFILLQSMQSSYYQVLREKVTQRFQIQSRSFLSAVSSAAQGEWWSTFGIPFFPTFGKRGWNGVIFPLFSLLVPVTAWC